MRLGNLRIDTELAELVYYFHGPFVYRLGHEILNLKRGVRFS